MSDELDQFEGSVGFDMFCLGRFAIQSIPNYGVRDDYDKIELPILMPNMSLLTTNLLNKSFKVSSRYIRQEHMLHG